MAIDGAMRMGAKRMGAKRMEVKTPVLTDKRGLTETFLNFRVEQSRLES